jgi:hypothetical protein
VLEYRQREPDWYRYSRWCELYCAWESRLSPTMRQAHPAAIPPRGSNRLSVFVATDPASVVYRDAKDSGRRLEVLRWGLIPYWAKEIKIGLSTINARAERGRHQAGLSRGIPAAALPRPARQLLRMEKRPRQASSPMPSR